MTLEMIINSPWDYIKGYSCDKVGPKGIKLVQIVLSYIIFANKHSPNLQT